MKLWYKVFRQNDDKRSKTGKIIKFPKKKELIRPNNS